jgi:hypothetical protein
MARKTDRKARDYEVQWQFDPRIIGEHFGYRKYSSSARAIGELVANSLDAGARDVRIDLVENELTGIEQVRIADNGRGMSREDIEKRFAVVGVGPSANEQPRLGRLGVGRLAVARVGAVSTWITSALTGSSLVRSTFILDEGATSSSIRIHEEVAPAEARSGTEIVIDNLLDADDSALTPSRLREELLTQFCAYLIGNTTRQIWLNGSRLDVNAWVSRREFEEVAFDGEKRSATIHHLVLVKPPEKGRVGDQILYSGKGRTIFGEPLESPPHPNYLGVVECPYLDGLVTANREGLYEMDPVFMALREVAKNRIDEFALMLAQESRHSFMEVARTREYYPYRNVTDPVTEVRQAMYDVALDRINTHVGIERMPQKQQQLVFKLLQRALENENLEAVLMEVANLSDEDLGQFKKVLERTTLNAIVRLSSEVTIRLEFLDILHELVYGAPARTLKERSQLHKILEPHCWIFGAAFHLATSDRGFREVVRRHRAEAVLPPCPEDELLTVSGIDDIPDLFLAAEREYPVSPKHRRLLVELKAPRVSLGLEQIAQGKRYATTVAGSPKFDTQTADWTINVASSKATAEAEAERSQQDREYGLVFKHRNVSVYAFTWAEIIDRARQELQLVRDHLVSKSRELSVSDYLRSNFPEVLSRISPLAKSA